MVQVDKSVRQVVAGLLLAGVGWVLSVGLAGAGHGWVGPLVYSWMLFLAYPAVLHRSTAGPRWILVDVAMVFAGVASDVLVYLTLPDLEGAPRWPTESFVPGIDQSMLPVLVLWLGLWILWQFLAVRALRRDLRAWSKEARRQHR